MAVMIILLLAVLGFFLYKMGFFSSDNQEDVEADIDVATANIIPRIRASLTELERQRRNQRNQRLNYTSAQLSRMDDPPKPTWDLIGQPFILDMKVENASENGWVSLKVGEDWNNWVYVSARVPNNYAFDLNKGQLVRFEGIILDGDYETMGNFPIWCTIGDARLDGVPVLERAQLTTGWGPGPTPVYYMSSGLPVGGRGPSWR
jgi:hypothetical protein